MECPRCGGSGICIECEGRGFVTCKECNGTGKIAIELSSGREKTSPCMYCHGKGLQECSPRCESCGGIGSITAEFQKTVQEKYTPSFTKIKEYGAFISLALLVINLLLFLAGELVKHIYQEDYLFYYGALYAPLVARGEWWRMITPIFLHIDLWHLLLNSYCLFILCPPIEKTIGPLKFTGLYIFSGIAGHLLSLILIPGAWSAGASGALFGVLGAYFGLNYRHRLFHPTLMQQLLFWLLINLGIGFFGGLNINIWAHLGGLIGGFLFSLFLKVE